VADTKLTGLTEISAPALEDLSYTVDDPGGTPVSNKLTHARLGGLLSRSVCHGRLTTETGVAVSPSDRSSQGTLYFTPYNGNSLSVYDGTRWKLYAFSEISLALSLVSGAVYSLFVYDNAGTLTLDATAWQNATFTVTIASPGVVTYNSHGLSNGDSVLFTTSGALPTGLSANTVYWVINQAANTFQLAATVGGTAINTSGSQSGTHTAYVVGLGPTSAATLNTVMGVTTQDSVLVKSGATERRFLGVIRASGANVTEDSATKRYVWNYTNRVLRQLVKGSTSSHSYASGTIRAWNADATLRVEWVAGEFVTAPITIRGQLAAAATTGSPRIGFALDTTLAYLVEADSMTISLVWQNTTTGVTPAMRYGAPGLAKLGAGTHYLQAIQDEINAQTSTFGNAIVSGQIPC
jgi:hypothetical protein